MTPSSWEYCKTNLRNNVTLYFELEEKLIPISPSPFHVANPAKGGGEGD
jgi:hypothetical protein